MKTNDFIDGIYVSPIYKIGVTASIPSVTRGKAKGKTEVTASFISKYKTAKELMTNEPEYFFSRFKGIKDELKDKVEIVREEILAETNTSHTKNARV